jgi:hypothetical protein
MSGLWVEPKLSISLHLKCELATRLIDKKLKWSKKYEGEREKRERVSQATSLH